MPGPWFTLSFLQFLVMAFQALPLQVQPSSGELTLPFALTDTAASARFNVNTVFKNKAPSAIRISVDSLVNPSRSSLAVRLDIIINEKDSFQLGTFSPFPSDKPGNYLVSARPLRERLSNASQSVPIEKAVLRFRLTSYTKYARIRVHIRAVTWVFR